MSGTLYVVATPIGNLGDITLRALETLRECDFVAAEDTRVARRLLSHFGIDKPVVSYYEHNTRRSGPEILSRIAGGENCALTTDAGTPAVSDPGALLVAECREAGITVAAVPGPSALAAAVSLSGIEGARFTFEGFLTQNRAGRREHLESLKKERRPMIFYEAPHKLLRTLEDFSAVFGPERGVFFARELTKIHEQTFRATIGDAVLKYRAQAPRGEFVLIVDGAPESPRAQGEAETLASAVELAFQLLKDGASHKDAAREAAARLGAAKNAVYEALLTAQEDKSL